MTIAITPIMRFGWSGNGQVMPYWPPDLLWISAAWASAQPSRAERRNVSVSLFC